MYFDELCILLSLYRSIELLLYKIYKYLVSVNIGSFPKGVYQITLPPSVYESSISSPTLRNVSVCYILIILVSIEWYFIVILFFIFLMKNEVEHIFMIVVHLDDLN